MSYEITALRNGASWAKVFYSNQGPKVSHQDFKNLREAVGIWHATRVTVDASELRQLLAEFDRAVTYLAELDGRLEALTRQFDDAAAQASEALARSERT